MASYSYRAANSRLLLIGFAIDGQHGGRPPSDTPSKSGNPKDT